MDLNKNPVLDEIRVKDTYKKSRNIRERWMMDHGVKYYKYPFEYNNFYGGGKSTRTPRPSLTKDISSRFVCDYNCPFTWMRDESGSSRGQYLTDISKLGHLCRDTIQDGHAQSPYSKVVLERTGTIACCKCGPESRYGICSDYFYSTFYKS